MAEYLHGAYGQVSAVGTKVSAKSQGAIVYVGTAPVNTVAGGAANVNVPVVVNNIAEARKQFGYSDDWAKYTLCEAMHAHFEYKGVGPLIFINVLDLTKHKADESSTKSLTPKNGKITIPEAGDVILDSVTVEGKEKTDYTVSYSIDKQTITIAEVKPGGLGEEELTVKYDSVDPSKVDSDAVIGTTDGLGLNTGLYALKDVYQITGYIPSYLACPGFSSDPTVHSAMYSNSVKVNGHWDAFMFADIPITSKQPQEITIDKVKEFKDANGYTHENEKVFYPLAQGTDGKTYHLSVLAAANFQKLLIENAGIPYKSSSNTVCDLIAGLYLGEKYADRVLDDSIINELLNKNGIASAAFVSGHWAIWGAHTGEYDQDNADQINVAETNRMMLYYISNDFQARRMLDVDKPLTPNDIKSIVAQEQTRLDALLSIGALTYGTVYQDASADARSDLMNGDHVFTFDVTTTPLAKSLTAKVNWTDKGFETYFEAAAD